jgi:hypothetical protein
MNRGRVGEERGGKEMDGCPLTVRSGSIELRKQESHYRACVVCDGGHMIIIFLSAAYLQNVKVQCELWPPKIKSL